MREQAFRVTGIGELVWDLLPSGPRLGGAPYNAVAHLARFLAGQPSMSLLSVMIRTGGAPSMRSAASACGCPSSRFRMPQPDSCECTLIPPAYPTTDRLARGLRLLAVPRANPRWPQHVTDFFLTVDDLAELGAALTAKE
jgi:hypothetical protein